MIERDLLNQCINKYVLLNVQFRYADCWDKLMTVFGALCALGHGASWPYMLVLLSDTIGQFVDFARYDNFLDEVEGLLSMIGFTKDDARKHVEKLLPYCPMLDSVYQGDNVPNCSKIASIDNLFDEMEDLSIHYICGGFIVMALAFSQCYCFFVASERQIIRMRSAFFRNILRQDMAFFDTSSTGELAVKLTDDIGKIHDSIGDKVGTSIQWFGSAVGGAVMCYAYGWELALMMQIASPLLFISFAVVGSLYTNMSRMEREAYAKAGGVAEEVISSMRTVQAFGGQEKEALRYARGLTEAKDLGVRKSMVNGIGTGIGWCIIFANWGLGFWYGGWLVRHSDYSVKDMMTVFFTSLIGCLSLGLAMPSLITINTGRVAAFSVFQIIDRKSKIDSLSTAGACPPGLKGSVSLKGVHFCYPSRPDVKVLNGIDLDVPAGKTVALVGSSGCGKSTVIQLLLRFYDPERGQVYFDDVDIRGINIKYLRKKVGFVGQEPVLFSTTIADNIRWGQDGVTMEEIVDACRRANAYDFIMKMPDQFNTQVGERGAKLSGGQKQRIAIARALVKNPAVLLLDEATSALDTESESIVQDALEKASKGRTTIVVAHRLTTVRNADLIVAFEEGMVAETGTHDELMVKGGVYYSLVSSQVFIIIYSQVCRFTLELETFDVKIHLHLICIAICK
ncbi:ATP-binding cassette sub-family B member 1 [Elysia marginata]|uniref:ATP-binding cassette sub-family B member 1 n=1 Tax=Elysia marginata TaxID=1093978 RepID=A0AAV4GYH4_9GAST|nr:ATP-binding cassette sub-family B member 1 [Elysia marginata]